MIQPLADEYQIRFLKKECHKVMIEMLNNNCALDLKLRIYSHTEIYSDLEELQLESLSKLKLYSLKNLQNEPRYNSLNDKLPIVEARLRLYEANRTNRNTTVQAM